MSKIIRFDSDPEKGVVRDDNGWLVLYQSHQCIVEEKDEIIKELRQELNELLIVMTQPITRWEPQVDSYERPFASKCPNGDFVKYEDHKILLSAKISLANKYKNQISSIHDDINEGKYKHKLLAGEYD